MKTWTRVAATCAALEREPSLAPNPHLNGLFSDLVRTIVSAKGSPWFGAFGFATRLRRLCARGESELEHAWAHRIAASRRPDIELERFPYTENYRRLCEIELDLIKRSGRIRPCRVLFVGSGPLPLSAMILARRGVRVTAVDLDHAACEASRRLVARLGLSDRIEILRQDARAIDPSGYDVVLLAALVGATAREKRVLVNAMLRRMDSGGLLLARSARGWRTLLYPPVPERAITEGELRAVHHPTDDVINSALVFRAPRTV